MTSLLDHNVTVEEGGLKGIMGSVGSSLKKAKDFGLKQFARGAAMAAVTRPYVWWGAMVGVFVFMPLVFEGQREAEVLKEEQVMIKVLREEGFSSNQIAQMGYSSAVAPSVLEK
uniref:Uncharacterized protein n=1 Tax=Phaeomonas parva TaxID=124430 RepID=A0A6U4GSJ7_9STRA|mmetsp:Transcript_31565/g.100163  ORF Transcript_31565/g.100163 Transcript_31565/m.100163 type:complete len:114 (+) Transcript_31565:182-523(+)|eukprot:CAMPEP_0118853152 /NCGR_PEP_ID=MMETSP1163-20130328/1848_1 /TAXON_ID=124430 /ORGANISM="Phaeomonas parva, Strain CCMP2877" /LENGTH=113 /DNA_ID=CAMNT_0006785651 /DNA_START=364 /DNA_END=705 /DNA_ORIENTATION=-